MGVVVFCYNRLKLRGCGCVCVAVLLIVLLWCRCSEKHEKRRGTLEGKRAVEVLKEGKQGRSLDWQVRIVHLMLGRSRRRGGSEQAMA